MRLSIPAIMIFWLIVSTSAASAKEVSGTVTEKESGEPIYGAAVFVKGTKIGTLTDKDGLWTLTDVPHEDFILVFQMTGYRTVEIKATGGVVHARLEVSMFNMGEIVVTGTQTKHLFEDTPVKTEVIPKRQIEAVVEPDLFGVLQFTPGVRVENNCQNCGFSQLRMLGLEGGYSQILINGDPVVSTMAGVYGLQQFPEQMIESLEIVKGGGSALYGANAIGGVVNIRLRRPAVNTGGVSFDYKVAGDHARAESGFFSEMTADNNKYGMFIFGNARRQNGYDRDDDGFTDIGEISGETLGFTMYRTITEQSELTGSVHRIHENRRGGNSLTKPSHQADISEAIESYRWGGNVKYTHNVNSNLSFDAGYSFALANRDTYYGAGRDPNAYGRTENPVHYVSGLLHYSAGSHSMTGGVTYLSEYLKDEAVSYNRIIDDTYNDMGIFIQDDFSFAERYTVVAGVRLDKHSLLDNPVISPRVSTLMKITDGWKLRGSVSTGFKPPQVFDEDLHITQVGGEGHIYKNSDGLAEEKSISLSATLDYMGVVADHPVQCGITAFHTSLTDQFQLVEADDPSTDYFEFERRNGDGLTVSGMELQAGFKPVKTIETQGSFTFQSDKLDSPEPDFGISRLFRTPGQYGNLIVYYTPHHRLSVVAAMQYTGAMKVPHYAGYIETDRLETTDSFVTMDLGFTYELIYPQAGGQGTLLKVGIKNITDTYQDDLDRGIDRDAGYIYGPSTPRMIYAGIMFGL
ncbi:TonB-dependent receptor [bacterium]|nr:TonB-dependent receptor [bacterium]